MNDSSRVHRLRDNGRLRRLGRLGTSLPRLLWRGLAHRGKRRYFKRLVNTYHGNRINMSLVLRTERSDRQIRRAAFGAVATYVRNSVLYSAPRLWAGFDIYNEEALDRTLGLGKGLIVATQHLGPQRYGFLHIAGRGMSVSAAMTEQFIEQSQGWLDLVHRDLGSGPQVEAADRFTLLAVEEPSCALKMMRALRRNEAVVFDIDGNIGVGGEAKTRDGAPILRFLGREVHVRPGVAYLAYRSGAPILPAIALWSRSGRPELHIHEPLMPAADESQEAFTGRALELLYGQLEEVLRERPEQWEMWPHLFKWMQSPPKLAEDPDRRRHFEQARRWAETILADGGDSHWIVRREDAFVLRVRGKWLFIDARHFRFFVTSSLMARTLDHFYSGPTVDELVRSLGRSAPRDAILDAMARLRLLDLMEPAGRRAEAA